MSQSGLGEQRNEKQGEAIPAQPGSKSFQLRQKMVSIGNDYWIENEQGEHVYEVDGKIGLKKVFDFNDAQGKKLAKLRKHFIAIKETMEVEGADGKTLAVVRKDLFTPFKEHFSVSLSNGRSLEIHGNILDHEYAIREGQTRVAQVSKKLLHLRDSYSIVIEPGQDEVVLLSVVVCIDEMTHPGN